MDAADYPISNFSPFLLQISGEFGIRWYGLAYLAGIALAWWFLLRWSRRGQLPATAKDISDAVMYLGLGMIIGGRLAYSLFYYSTESSPAPLALLKDPLYIFRMWEGGMASHGGVAGLFIGTVLLCRKRSFHIWVFGDAVAAVAGFGVLFGRLANFINGELWGRVTDVPWAWLFPASIPFQHYPSPPLGSEAWVAWVRAFAEPRHPSQLYAAALEGMLILIVGLLIQHRHRRPGLTVGVVICTYSVGRFINEFWREPDAGYALYGGWMSKGQALTIPLALVGVGFVIWAWRRGPKPELYGSQISPTISTLRDLKSDHGTSP